MSRSRSDLDQDTQDPARPADHIDQGAAAGAAAVNPTLGPREWLGFAWRQLTSMRTALFLLLALALASVPGSIFPQRSADPNGVIQYLRNNPGLGPVLDTMQLFDVYSSVWFSAIYLLLFVSLVGCVIPRIRHHGAALRGRPPRTPARFSRLPQHFADDVTVPTTDGHVGLIDRAEAQLRRAGYRVERYDTDDTSSVSAERGYLRETGNLVFHGALVGVLVSVLIGNGNAYTGQRVIVEGTTFVNTLSGYSSFSAGRFVDSTQLPPYSLTLDKFDVTYQSPGERAAGQAGDFAAHLTVRKPDGSERAETVRVNAPVEIAGERLYLMGNGYAPTITVRNAAGDIAYSDFLPFLPQDSMMTSLGIIKVPDGLPEQIGLLGFLYPTQGTLASGAYTSIYPDLVNPVVTFNVFSGDLGIDDGTARSVYRLDTSTMTQLTGGDTGVAGIELRPGETADLPNGWGTVTFENASADGSIEESVRRFASVQVQRDAGATWVLVFATLATAGLITALLTPRRRVWAKASALPASEAGPRARLEWAALARGEDPALGHVLQRLRDDHLTDPTDDPPTNPKEMR